MPGLASAVEALTSRRAALAAELAKIDAALDALRGLGAAGGVRTGRKGGTWRPGGRGRPPKWYVARQKAKGARKARKRVGRRKRKVSAKVLAALARGRAALAAKRAKAAEAKA